MKIFDDNEVKLLISQKIRKARKDSQGKTAEEAGISEDTLSLIERGITVPSTTTVINIFNAVGLEPNEFFEDFTLNKVELVDNKLNVAFNDLSTEEKNFILYIVDYIKSHRK